MRFWDSSALLPLLVEESTSALMKELFEEEYEIAVWWGTEIECHSALARRESEGALTSKQQAAAEKLLKEILECTIEVNPSTEIKRIARHLLRMHPLRVADALQLAAAVAIAGDFRINDGDA